MACVLAVQKDNKWICSGRNEECLLNEPNFSRCEEMYGEVPEDNDENETVENIIDRIIDEEGDFESEEDEIDNIADGNI